MVERTNSQWMINITFNKNHNNDVTIQYLWTISSSNNRWTIANLLICPQKIEHNSFQFIVVTKYSLISNLWTCSIQTLGLTIQFPIIMNHYPSHTLPYTRKNSYWIYNLNPVPQRPLLTQRSLTPPLILIPDPWTGPVNRTWLWTA